jgi:hypothetical protein
MKQKRDANGKFVKMYLTREEYDVKIADMQETIDSIAHQAQEAKNESAFWRQEYDSLSLKNKGLEASLKKITSMRNWLYENAGFFLKSRYIKEVEKGTI